jgi:transcriptional regulator with XRE-family HTH domain
MADPTRIGSQLRHFRKKRGWTQTELAERTGLKRTALGAYEEGRAEPRLAALVKLAHVLDVSLDALVLGGTEARMEQDVRVLPIAVDRAGDFERISAVSVKAAAGYASGLGDPEWIAALPHFALPLPEVPQDRTLRFFQIEGDSMLPLPSGTWVLAEFVERMQDIGSGRPYILSTKEDGLLFKRVENRLDREGDFLCVSNNPAFTPYTLSPEEIREAWRAIGWFSTDWPQTSADIASTLAAIKEQINPPKVD